MLRIWSISLCLYNEEFLILFSSEKEYEVVKLTIALKENNLKGETVIEKVRKEVSNNDNIDGSYFPYIKSKFPQNSSL